MTLEQLFGGQLGDTQVATQIEFGAFAAPTDKVAGLGMIGPWNVYASGGGFPLTLTPLYEASGIGIAWAFNENEADGPANQLEFTASTMCVTDTSYDWTYTVSYRYADLLNYSLYGYEDPNAPLVTMDGHERYDLSGDTLTVDSSAVGMDTNANAVEFHVSGGLTQP